MDTVNEWGAAFPRPGYVQPPKADDLESLELARLTLTQPQKGISQRLFVMCSIFRWSDFNEGSPLEADIYRMSEYSKRLAWMADAIIAASHQTVNATGLEADSDE